MIDALGKIRFSMETETENGIEFLQTLDSN